MFSLALESLFMSGGARTVSLYSFSVSPHAFASLGDVTVVSLSLRTRGKGNG